MKNKRLFIVIAVTAILLAIPLIAMQFNTGVDWDLPDFIVMGILLFVTGMGIEFAWRKIGSAKKRFIALGVILIVFFLIWTELAVGIFGTPFAGN
ncbi:hypothetical protein C7S20_01155 [Christiangramia fulva]|uniref:Uncharacterized protein n=1 Tax=Christiangramia fulva TaxID=2126553 RepID=A0A2R3ZAM1_9FLAO|nr:hypothetical protein [Christiangramia fulva]AVR47280.1 hypothetical protein C7S20_01155 [Christiangramia fulva]